MKISSSGLTGQPTIAAPVAAPDLPPTARATGLPSVANAPAQHQSAVLGSAQAALHELPEIDETKVAALRDALARGEVRFDAGKLAGLIQRYHNGGGE